MIGEYGRKESENGELECGLLNCKSEMAEVDFCGNRAAEKRYFGLMGCPKIGGGR